MALLWAAAYRKLDKRASELHAAVAAARAAGVAEVTIAAYMVDAQERAGGHPPPVQFRA